MSQPDRAPGAPEISKHTAVIIVALFAVTVFGVIALLSNPSGQELLGMRIASQSSSANSARGIPPVINCIAAPCPGEPMPPKNDFIITSPAPNEQIITGQAMKIAWVTPTNADLRAEMVKILLVQPSPACLEQQPPCAIRQISPYIITNSTEHDGSFEWLVPASLPEAYTGLMTIRIETASGSQVAVSAPFSIKRAGNATPKVMSPAATDTWKVGDTYTIRWDQIGFPQTFVDIYLAPYSDIRDYEGVKISVKAKNNGQYAWKVPASFSSEYYTAPVVVRIAYPSGQLVSAPFWLQANSQQPLEITTAALPAGNAGIDYYAEIQASGGMAPYRWSISNSLTTGITINAQTGALIGRPKIGNHRVTIAVTDGSGQTVSRAYNLQVIGQPAASPHTAGSLVLGLDNIPSSVNLITNEGGRLMRRPFGNAEVFLSHGYRWDQIVPGNAGDQALFVSAPMYLASGTVVRDPRDLRTFYVVYSNNIVRGFSNGDVFSAMGYRYEMAYTTRLRDYTVGDPITAIEAHAPGTDVLDPQSRAITRIMSGNARLGYPNMKVYNAWHTFDNDFSKVLPINQFDRAIEIVGLMQPR